MLDPRRHSVVMKDFKRGLILDREDSVNMSDGSQSGVTKPLFSPSSFRSSFRESKYNVEKEDEEYEQNFWNRKRKIQRQQNDTVEEKIRLSIELRDS